MFIDSVALKFHNIKSLINQDSSEIKICNCSKMSKRFKFLKFKNTNRITMFKISSKCQIQFF